MKKVIATAAGILFAVFGLAILGLLMSLTFGALGKLFPGNFTNQLWGLVLFDIAAMIWALAFVFKCQSTGQYAVAAIGFLAAFVGTLGMVAVEVMLSGQTFVEVEDWVGQWLVYGFVIMTALHSSLLYTHHAAAPDIHEKINVGIARGEIVTEAIKQATQSLDVQKAVLAQTITQDIVNQVKRDLGLQRGQVIDLPALPVEDPQNTADKKPAFSLLNMLPFTWAKKNGKHAYESVVPIVTENKQATIPQPTATEEGQQAQAPTPFQGGPKE
jgi:apolipoprotein N-acyltransferase